MKSKMMTAVSIVCPMALLLAAASMPAVTAETHPAPNGSTVQTPRDLFGEKCSACHNLPNPTELSYTRDEWRKVVDKMLTRYNASDEISPTEASTIVDYLATFAPKPDAKRPNGLGQGNSLWASEPSDVWPDIPAQSIVTNFENTAAMSKLTPVAAGDHSRPLWRTVSESGGAPGAFGTGDGTAVRVSNPGATDDAFALLVDPHSGGANTDIKVRFRFVSGQTSPAVGIAFGLRDNQTYAVVRYNRRTNSLSLIDVAGPRHTTVQQSPLNGGSADSKTASLSMADSDWHTLRVMVNDGQVRAWIDSYKRINAALPGYTGGKVALWSQGDTIALFDDWTTDIYDR